MQNSEDIKAEIDAICGAIPEVMTDLLALIQREKAKAVSQALLEQQERLKVAEEALETLAFDTTSESQAIAQKALDFLRSSPTT